DVKIPMLQGSVSDAIQTLTDLGVNAEKVGEGNTVVAQSPVTGSTIAKGGTVYLYTESSHTVDYTEVPSFVGLSPQQVNEAVVWKHLNYVGRGASTSREDCYVSSQSIEAGTKVAVGTTIELEFMVYGDSD
ncbi:MAG: PASTA domain-containing protein, partial [Ruminococcus sp.]|nr:PASTA domain-containing protein [Ruminococcus sp.]